MGENYMKYKVNKKKKVAFSALAILVLIVIIASIFRAYVRNQNQLRWGEYRITECLYVNMASSDPIGENARLQQSAVTILEDSFQIVDEKGNVKVIENVTYETEKMNPEVIDAWSGLPISEYQSKKVCSIYSYRKEPYELYLLDDTVWLVTYQGTNAWSVSALEYVG